MRKKATIEKIRTMKKLKREGRTCKEISEVVGMHLTTVHNYVKDIPAKDEIKEGTKKVKIMNLLSEGRITKEIVEKVGVTSDYVRKIRESMEFDKVKREKVRKNIVKSKRQEVVDKINKDHELKKKEEEKYYKEQLKWEKKRIEERYPEAFEYNKIIMRK